MYCSDWISLIRKVIFLFYFILPYFIIFLLFRAACVAYGSSQARGQIGAAAASLCHTAASVTYTTTNSNAGSFIHRVRPGLEPLSSWILIGFVTTEPQQELLFF